MWTQKDPSACAVAQCALREGLGGMIGRQFAYLIDGTKVTRYHLNKDAQTRTAVFDDRGTMTPGPVLLSSPAPSQRLGHMIHRTNIHLTKQKAKVKSKSGRTSREQSDVFRKNISTRGFRSWAQVGLRPGG